MKTKFYNFLLNTRGEPVANARIQVYAYPISGGSAEYANIYTSQTGTVTTSYDTAILTNADGYFEFFVADLEEGAANGYEYQTLFKITWSGTGITPGSLDNIQFFDVTRRAVDVESAGEYFNRVVTNKLAKGWEDHRTDPTLDEHTQYLRTNGSRPLTDDLDLGASYGILVKYVKARVGEDLLITTNTALKGLTILNATGTVRMDLVDINGGAIDGTTVGATTPAAGSFTTLSSSVSGTMASMNITTLVATNSTLASSTITNATITTGAITTLTGTTGTITTINGTTGTITNLNSTNVNLDGGSIDGTTIGLNSAYPGYFSTLNAAVRLSALAAEMTNVTVSTLFASTSVKTGTLTVSGNTTLGDALGDSITINAGTVTIPNSLNFDSNTLLIDGSNNRVIVGNSAGTRKLEVVDTDIQLRLLYSTGVYTDLETTLGGDFQISSQSTSGLFDLTIRPKFGSQYYLGTSDFKWHKTFTNTLTTSAALIGQNGWISIGSTADPLVPIDVHGHYIRLRDSKTVATAALSGEAGKICWDSGFIYVCVDTDTWKRAALSTW